MTTKRSLTKSAIALLLCFAMLIGSTFAWFTDSATSADNVIKGGNLDAEMYFADTLLALDSDEWKNASDVPVFTHDNWEPGYTDIKYIKVKNAGNLSFRWRLTIEAQGEVTDLADVIDVYYVNPVDATLTSLDGLSSAGVLSNVIEEHKATEGVLLPAGETSTEYAVGETVLAIALHMQDGAGNTYQGDSIGDGFTLKLLASQFNYEEDAFGSDFDKDSEWPNNVTVAGNSASVAVTADAENKNTAAVTMTSKDGKIAANVPAGTLLADGATALQLSISDVADSQANITLDETEASFSIDVHINGVAEENTVVMAISVKELLPVGLNMGNYRFYHVENGATVEMKLLSDGATPVHNNYEYDPATGDVILHLASFSEVALVADTENAWEGEFDYTWYDASKTDLTIANADQLAAFGAIVGGMNGQTKDSFKDKTVKLVADINLGDKESENNPDLIFYPIGYYNSTGSYEKTSGVSVTSSVSSFEGTFDGNGNTISNFYQNTWEMFGDYNDGYSGTPNHYKDAMGLFGYVLNGTVKNLTVSDFSSDGEFTPTGVIAAYADGNSTFENIAITNCNPRVYNTGNGGIIGVAGDTSAADDDHLTLKNITVDNSNKISALWGSYDVACGGLVGMYRGNVDGNGNATGDTISFENCHVSAIIDVYNDVCANYQYYAYRYSGMIIGSVRHNTKNDEGKTIPNMTGISATGCTVNYGDWNDYYYCEFEKNTMASYSEDYQFSRVPHSELNFTDSNGNGVVDADERASVTGCKHTHTAEENHQAIYLPFHQLFTGYSWGVSSIGLKEYSGIVTDLGITEGDQQESVVKFESKFTGDFLYRVGNQNTVSIGSLFAAKDGATISNAGVWVKVEKIDENSNVSGTFTANTTDWTKGTIQFSGTGVVKVTIQDYNFCTPTELILEVVDAVNATGATSATSSDIVLLGNSDSSGFTVSSGHIFYGNGFKVTCSGKGTYLGNSGLSLGYITVKEGGVLDNVQIICNTFPTSYLYTSEVNELDEELSTEDKNRYKYQLSAVALSGDGSIISNCYIFGARNNIFVGQGNVTISNTTLESGSLANIQIKSTDTYTVTLDDVTTIQRNDVNADFDSSKKVLGFGVVVGDNESTSNPHIKLSGEFTQYNWVSSNDADLVSSTYAKAAINGALAVSEYQHKFDNITKVNMGIAYLNTQERKVTDERTNKATVPYISKEITMTVSGVKITGWVCSVSGAKNADDIPPEPDEIVLTPSVETMPEIVWSGESNTALSLEKVFDGAWKYKLTVDLDNIIGGSYTFISTLLKAQKYGQDLSFVIKDLNGDKVDSVALNALATIEYVIEITDNLNYGADGELVDESKTRYIPFIVYATKTSIEPPKFTNSGTATAIRLVASKGGDWRPAYTALTGVSVTYWSALEGKVKTVDLSTLYNQGTISSNVWTYTCDDYTLTITGGSVHSDGTTITPVVANNTLYFASTNKAFGTGTTSRNIILTYVFTDKNASTTWNRTETVTYSSLSEYDYNSFKNNGTLTAPSSSTPCVTSDTLVTLADGTQKRIDEVIYEDKLLVWDFYKGEYTVVPVAIIFDHGYGDNTVIKLDFSNGASVKVVNMHQFFDATLNKMVTIDATNVQQYVGHKFICQSGDGYSTVTLDAYTITNEYVEAWGIMSALHYNIIVEGIFSADFDPADLGLFNYFEIGENMKYDAEQMQADIEKYGLYTFEDFADYLTYEQFIAFNVQYFKISVEKGDYTFEGILALIDEYLNQ